MQRARQIQQAQQSGKQREREEILAAIKTMSVPGYQSMVADMFRREGYEVGGYEGPDADVVDMEVTRGPERMFVNYQLREIQEIPMEALQEMSQVLLRNGANGAYLITDGAFPHGSEDFARDAALVLIDGETLVDLAIELTLSDNKDKGLTAKLAKRFRVPGRG